MDRPLQTPVATLTDNTTRKTYNFPFNIDSLNWNYQVNTQSYDTIGGRVTQLLSVRASMMSLNGEAGNRENLLKLYETFKLIQDNQNRYKTSMTLHVPSQNLTFRVWLEQMQIGWDISTITYPYAMSFEMDQDLTTSANTVTQAAMNTALNNIAAGIGFSLEYTGLGTNTINLQFQDLQNALNNGLIQVPVQGTNK